MALTIRALDADLDQFRVLTGHKTANKALISAAKIGVTATAQLKAAQQTIARLEVELATYRQTMQNLTPLCLKVAELAAQSDLFADQGRDSNG